MTRAPVHRIERLAALGAVLLVASAGRLARADVFSPGPLSRAHERLEGLASCTRCHVAGQQLSADRCLECHVELRDRVARGRGLHGRIPAAERACETCHHEHQGRDFPLVDWGKGGRSAFDHARTGFPLRGKHRRAECGRCHDRRLVDEPLVREVLEKQPRRETFLGAPTACARCHFDEHRGAAGADCQRCHAEDAWRPARLFDHARTAYPLAGRHAKVACAKCHRVEQDPAPRAATPGQTPPVSPRSFVRYRPVAFQACTDCHKDPHQGRFGGACASCHSPDDWRKVSGAARERAFHERTRYPLRGAHARARCEACHPPSRPAAARYRGIAFARCTDCHADAHLGQLAALRRPAGAGEATCDGCHGLEAWLPARFETEDHDRLSYRLEGAHRAVACVLCHPRDPALEERVPRRLRAELQGAARPLRVSLARLAVKGASDCRTCHRDPHGGQLDARLAAGGCASCHEVASFRKIRFDHAKDSRFALTGKHAKAACGACHRPDASGVVRYRPLEAACASCHADPHAGQLAAAGATDCGRCHGTESWKEPLRFVHRRPFTEFALEGKHARVACDRCHPPVRVEGVEAQVRRYRPLPTECEDCHADFHRGAFRALAAGAPEGQAERPAPATAREGEGRPDLRARPPRPVEGVKTRCAACHSADGWDRVAFAHARTGFPLEGRHAEAPCKGCHAEGSFAGAVPRACAACHRDVHQGRLGQACDRCHDATAWAATTFTADAHRRTAFPLTGRHAVVPCESCHGDARDRGFTRPVRDCVACHEADFARAQTSAALPHDPGLTTCRGCHGTFRFQPAAFPAHDACFPIRSGHHAGVRCRDCHTSIPPVVEPLSCTSGSFDCRRCHSCAEHDPVSGFDCTTSRRCYECHRFGSAEDEARLGGIR
jgi:hypothetical protein